MPPIDRGDRHYFRKVSRRKNLVGFKEVGIGERDFVNWDACPAQQSDDPTARDSIEERSIRYRCVDLLTTRHKDIGIGELSDVAQHVGHQAIVETAPFGL